MSKEANYTIEKLVDFGLSRNEATIYLYLLERGGEAGGSKIATETHLHRQYIYRSLKKLLNLNLIEAVSHGKLKKYHAHSPAEIEKVARRRSLQAAELAAELQKISAIGNEQDFEIIQGVKALQQYEIDRILTVPEGSVCFFIGGASEGFFKVMAGVYEKDYHRFANKKKLKTYYLGYPGERNVLENARAHGSKYFEFRGLEKLPKGVMNIMILNDTVSFYTFVSPPLLYIIKSSAVSENLRAFFQMLWDMADKKNIY